jgi:serine/threonine protein kinase
MLNESKSLERRELRVGDLVGDRYELQRELGRGGGGIVFEALHRFTGRSTALKVVSTDVPRSQVAELSARLMREARALASVRHPGIVDVLDGGTLGDGTTFIVLEKLDGRTLEGLLAARGQLAREDAVAIGLQLCDALDAMHRAGVVHRDLKPANVFVVRDRDGAERLKLLDFGIASVHNAETDKLTANGAIMGTPAYMSPEQLLAAEVDHRADVYALGVTLFECMTGRLPFEGNYQAVLLQVCAPNAKAPKVADIVPEVGRELSAVVEQATAREPEQRFATALAFGRALYGALPTARTKTSFLGPPPVPRHGPPASRQQLSVEQRRSTPRAPYTTPVDLVIAGVAIKGHSEDISEGGMLVVCWAPCEAGGVATVRFALPIEGTLVTWQAHVRWVRAARPSEPQGPRAIGLEFVVVTEPMRASIARYVTQRR